MAVLPMQRVTLCALKKNRKKILELLQRFGIIEINDTIPEDSVFRKSDVTAAVTLLNKNVDCGKEALKILEAYTDEKKPFLGMLNGRKEVSPEIYDEFSKKYDSIVGVANNICSLTKQIAEQKAEILRLKTQRDMLNPWISLDIPMNFSGTKYTSAFIGTLPEEWTLEQIYEHLAEQMPINVDIISTSRSQTCIFVLCSKEKEQSVSELLRGCGFSYTSVSSDKAPAEQIRDIEKQIADTELAVSDEKKQIASLLSYREDIRFLVDYNTMRAEKYGVIGHLLQSKNVFVITGYMPEKDKHYLEDTLTKKYEAAVEFEQPDEDENVPVLLKNNGFSKPLEGVVESFSMPGKGETDPTTAMSFFYYMLFGLMLSDAAYGALIMLGCAFGLLRFRKTIEESMRNTLKMYFFCGMFTTFWGVMFGSYFGDIISVVSSTFFGKTVSVAPVWFFPVKEPMRMLTISMLIGIIHLFTGLGMKLYQLVKQKNYKAVIYDVVFWYILLIGCILKLLSMQMFTDILSLKFVLPSTIGTAGGIAAVVGAVGIVLTNGRESKNPFKRFLKGLYSLYGITGYLSDVLSYSRLLALGLATGVICTVINKMASMTVKGPLGIIPFTLVFIIGHLMNIAINALGAYVHTNRLQYVEFFGKFYEGGRKKFSPFSVKTKYYKFKEK